MGATEVHTGRKLRFRPSTTERGEPSVVLEGELADLVDLDALRSALPTPAILDLGGIERITSIGVKFWLLFVDDLEQAGHPVEWQNVSPAVVRQLNLLSRMRGSAVIKSVQAPFICTGCESETVERVDVTQDPMAQIAAPRTCADCGGKVELDDATSDYLSFLRR
jgi:hypothetical protein